MQTDASKEGWEAVVNESRTGGRWKSNEMENSINYLELLAIFFGLKCFFEHSKSMSIKVETDNTTAVSYINNMGGIKSKKCNDLSKIIWLWCLQRDLDITATHLPGSANQIADLCSRKFSDSKEWKLDPTIFTKLCQIWGKPEIDIFASRIKSIRKLLHGNPILRQNTLTLSRFLGQIITITLSLLSARFAEASRKLARTKQSYCL